MLGAARTGADKIHRLPEHAHGTLLFTFRSYVIKGSAVSMVFNLIVLGVFHAAAHVVREVNNRPRRRPPPPTSSSTPSNSSREVAVTRQPERMMEAPLRNLPDVYTDLRLRDSHQRRQIRVISLHPGSHNDPLRCTMEVMTLGTVVYEALSYRWSGAKDQKLKVNGVECLILENLATALRYLRPFAGAPRRIWFDAICIDQEDRYDEKDDQLMLMGDIYKSAQRVLVWLGAPDGRSETAISYFNTLDGGYPGLETLRRSYEEDKTFWLDFGDGLLQCDWWGRAWMVQEMVLAQELQFICGGQTMREDLFFVIASYAQLTNRQCWRLPLPSKEVGLRRIAIHPMMAARTLKASGPDNNNIGTWITNFHGWEATDPKDRVYAYLGLVENCPIRPNKNTPWTVVYRDLTLHVITSTRKLDFLCLGRGPARAALHGSPRLPSWVPDFRIPHGTNPALPPLNCGLRTAYNASAGAKTEVSTPRSAIDQGYLVVMARRFHDVFGLGPIHDFDHGCVNHSMRLVLGDKLERRTWPYIGKLEHSLATALGRTLVWDLNHARDRCSDTEGFFWGSDLMALQLGGVEINNNWSSHDQFEVLVGDVEGSARSFEADLVLSKMKYRLGRRLAVLRGGWIGMVPPDTREGDQVFVLAGASVPMVLRQWERSYELIGECYIHGIMDGEVFQDKKLQNEMISLA